jgi:hypothetical protein
MAGQGESLACVELSRGEWESHVNKESELCASCFVCSYGSCRSLQWPAETALVKVNMEAAPNGHVWDATGQAEKDEPREGGSGALNMDLCLDTGTGDCAMLA